MDYSQIGKRIQEAREEAGLSQGELAARIGCTQSALSNYELGKRHLRLGQLEQIAQVLGKPSTYFMESPADRRREDHALHLVRDPRLREILLEAVELPLEERERVLDYIKWRKNVVLLSMGDAMVVWEGSKFSLLG